MTTPRATRLTRFTGIDSRIEVFFLRDVRLRELEGRDEDDLRADEACPPEARDRERLRPPFLRPLDFLDVAIRQLRW